MDKLSENNRLNIRILQFALETIKNYGAYGICPLGCDCPNMASEALKSYEATIAKNATVEYSNIIEAFDDLAYAYFKVCRDTENEAYFYINTETKNIIELIYENKGVKENPNSID